MITKADMLLTGTPYTTLFYMLLNPDWARAVFVFDKNFPRKIIDRLLERNVNCRFLSDGMSETEYLEEIKRLGAYVRQNNVPIMGHDFLSISKYFVNPNFTVLEDGLANYCDYDYVTKQKKAQYFIDDGHEYVPFGYDKMISKIYLTGKMAIPHELQPKVELVNLKSLWLEQSDERRRELLNIFSFPMEQFQSAAFSKRDQLLLTQNFHDLGFLSLDEQIDIYKSILLNYDRERIIIKPHPLDTIEYDKYFPEYMILARHFPIEMFELLGITIERTISINSSAQYGVFADSKSDHFYDIFEQHIEPKFGRGDADG